MSNPNYNQLHTNKNLTNISIAYIQEAKHFIHGQVFPQVPVEKQGDQYVLYNKGDFLRALAQVRADGTESAGGDYKFSRESYFAEVYAIHKNIGDQARQNSDAPINLDRTTSIFLTQSQLITREKDWFETFYKQGVWADDIDVSAGNAWDTAGSTPIEDIELQVEELVRKTGQDPMTFKMVFSTDTWRILKNHPDVIERIKFSSTNEKPTKMSLNSFAALLEIGECLVGRAIEAPNPQGAANADDTQFIGATKSALLVYVTPNPSLEEPSAGYIFSWTGLLGRTAFGAGAEAGASISKFRMVEKKSDRVESEMAYDMKITAADAGIFFYNTIT